jgi:virginiamycin B lyase
VIATLLLAASISVKTYAVPQKRIPTEIVRHGNELWFTAWTVDRVQKDSMGTPKLHAYFGRVTPRVRFKITPTGEGYKPAFATHTPDGTLWFTDAAQTVFWRIGKDGRITKAPSGMPAMYIAYAGGDLWCSHGPWITRHSLDGPIKESYDVPDTLPPPMTSLVPPLPAPNATSLAVGADGAIWFPESYRKRMGRLTTSGEMTFHALPHDVPAYSKIVAGADGALWYMTSGDTLGRITTSGEITTVPVGFAPFTLATDSAGRIWYAHANQAGFIARDGTREEFDLPQVRNIRSLVEGPDGAMWFADDQALTIGRLTLSPPGR